MIRVTIGTGFITNSSSVVHYFDKALLKDPDVVAFIKAYGLEDGFVGKEIWNRSLCASLLVTKEQKALVQRQFTGDLYPYGDIIDTPTGPSMKVDDDDAVVIIYGDEYTTFASTLCRLLEQAEERMPDVRGLGSTEFH
jgi:hypothetical protein